MKKYRARWDYERWRNGKKLREGSCWLTDDDHIGCPEDAAVGSLSETVNRIARMSLNEPRTVTGGIWVLESKRKSWIPIDDGME